MTRRSYGLGRRTSRPPRSKRHKWNATGAWHWEDRRECTLCGLEASKLRGAFGWMTRGNAGEYWVRRDSLPACPRPQEASA